jgi:hypothetical protein
MIIVTLHFLFFLLETIAVILVVLDAVHKIGVGFNAEIICFTNTDCNSYLVFSHSIHLVLSHSIHLSWCIKDIHF